MFTLMLAQRNLDAARATWLAAPLAANRLAFDRAVRAFAVAEAKLNSSIRTDIVKAA